MAGGIPATRRRRHPLRRGRRSHAQRRFAFQLHGSGQNYQQFDDLDFRTRAGPDGRGENPLSSGFSPLPFGLPALRLGFSPLSFGLPALRLGDLPLPFGFLALRPGFLPLRFGDLPRSSGFSPHRSGELPLPTCAGQGGWGSAPTGTGRLRKLRTKKRQKLRQRHFKLGGAGVPASRCSVGPAARWESSHRLDATICHSNGAGTWEQHIPLDTPPGRE